MKAMQLHQIAPIDRSPLELPEAFSDVAAAPLLCAGIIGYRALRRAVDWRFTASVRRPMW